MTELEEALGMGIGLILAFGGLVLFLTIMWYFFGRNGVAYPDPHQYHGQNSGASIDKRGRQHGNFWRGGQLHIGDDEQDWDDAMDVLIGERRTGKRR